MYFINSGLPSICSPSNAYSGPLDEGDYATLRTGELLQISEYDEVVNLQRMQHIDQDNYGRDDISEEGKLLECVRDESVTYASAKDLEPPLMISPLAPVTVTVHTSSEVHVSIQIINIIKNVSRTILIVLDFYIYSKIYSSR